MDIQHPAAPLFDEIWRQKPHISRQTKNLDAGFLKLSLHGLFMRLPVGAKMFARDRQSRNAEISRDLQPGRIFFVRQNDHNLRRIIPSLGGFNQ